MIVVIENKNIQFEYYSSFYEDMKLCHVEKTQIKNAIIRGNKSGITIDRVWESIPELNIYGKWKLL